MVVSDLKEKEEKEKKKKTKNRAAWGEKRKSIPERQVSSDCRLYPAVSRWMMCMCFNVWHSVNQPQKCYWTNKKKEKRKKRQNSADWKREKIEMEMTENFSVLFCSWYLLSEVTNSYGNIQNKMWNTVSYTLAFDFFFFPFYNFSGCLSAKVSGQNRVKVLAVSFGGTSKNIMTCDVEPLQCQHPCPLDSFALWDWKWKGFKKTNIFTQKIYWKDSTFFYSQKVTDWLVTFS